MINKIILLFLFSSLVFPCDCYPLPEPEEAFESVNYVFSGKVVEALEYECGGGDGGGDDSCSEENGGELIKVLMEVYDVWKGDIENYTIVKSESQYGGGCGIGLQMNQEYLVYGNENSSYIFTTICTGTKLLEDANSDLDYILELFGCTDISACNYNTDADIDDGSCEYTSGTWHVSEDGDNSNCGSSYAPLKSIQLGIDSASDGDTVLVYPGSYYGPIDFKRKNLVLGSLFMLSNDESYIDETIIMGSDTNISPFVQIDGISELEVELNGFTFQDISLNELSEGVLSYVLINVLNASPKIVNNQFNNFVIYGEAESAAIFCKNSNSLIENNTFSGGNIGLNYELTGWVLSKNSNLTIKNNVMENGYVGFSDPTGYIVSVESDNLISGNTFNNVAMGYCWTCAAIVALEGSSLNINNNLILRATGDGYGAVLASDSEYISNNNTLIANRGGYTNLASDGVIKNDIVINYPNGWGTSITLDDYSTIEVSYSNIEGGYDGEGNIDTDPLFTNIEEDDYSLQLESPCIDAGIADLDGDGIDDIIDFFGLSPDMGKYEYEYDFNFGDVNFDNEINVFDVVLIVSFILGESINEIEYLAADINQDSNLNILDIVILVNIILNP
tara:strand:- start:51 stop:1904 length:1854 start_codon:yes stop_codon:yes gene_type:complete